MRLLILGGTAFLSARVARTAVERGHDVTCLARGSDREPPAGTHFLRADRQAGTSAYAGATGEWDAVLDVSRQPEHVREALVALAGRTRHWTFVSSGSVYALSDAPGADESAQLLEALEPGVLAELETYGEGKVACEQLCQEALGERLHISRAGLIGGAGDPTDRFGYWPARFALNNGDPVLVPDARQASTQVIAVGDLAGWLLDAAERDVTGPLNAYGDPATFGAVLDLAAQVAGSTSPQVIVDQEWLAEQKVDYWAGPDSVPLWLPPDYAGFGDRSNRAAVAAGMRLSALEDLLAESLAYERERGLDRERQAGLSSEREKELLKAWADR
jgi:2'-hydroxyisoflavone reductase